MKYGTQRFDPAGKQAEIGDCVGTPEGKSDSYGMNSWVPFEGHNPSREIEYPVYGSDG